MISISLLDDLKTSIQEGFQENLDQVADKSKDLFKVICENLEESSNKLLQELMDFVLYTPTLAEDPVIMQLWTIVRIISFSLIGMMFVWEAFKKVLSVDNVVSTVEFKTMMSRLIYGLIFAVFSLDIIDLMINFNQSLIDAIRTNFTINIKQELTVNGVFGFIMVFALMAVQMVLGIKLILQYWMRIAEIWLMAILGPIVYVLWINPNWGGYLRQWVSRLTSTIGTTLIWAILFAIYSAMVSLVSSTGMLVGFTTLGPIAAMCLSIALLLTMHQTPAFLRGFMQSQSSAVDLMRHTAGDVIKMSRIPVNITKKATGWLRRK